MTKHDMVDIILKDIPVNVMIGVWPKERKKTQKVSIDVTVRYNAKKSKASDKVKDAVDYYQITQAIISLAEKTNYHLLESLLGDILQLIMQDKRIIACEIYIHKPEAMQELGVQVALRGQAKR